MANRLCLHLPLAALSLLCWGGKVIFILLAMVLIILFIVLIYLPEGHPPDTAVSLKPKPLLHTYLYILLQPQFYTHTFAGAFSFATLFIYVAGSPISFMEVFHVCPEMYGAIFALLSLGFIGGSQLNIYLIKNFGSKMIFSFALNVQVSQALPFSQVHGIIGWSFILPWLYSLFASVVSV
jgi:DHA1 family bicyclomycin/chloramphenicol resistance-like MFS transporter